MRKHFHNFVYCRFCGAEYDAGFPGGPFASDGEHDCGLVDALHILKQRLEEDDYPTLDFRDEMAAHLAALQTSAAAATLGRKGGSVTSPAKTAAARANASKPPREGKTRGRPRKTTE